MTDSYSPPSDLAGKAKDMLRDVKGQAAGLTDDLSRAAKTSAEHVSQTARQFADTAKDKLGESVTERKSMGAEYIGSIAHATGRAAEAFEDDLPQAAHYIRQASEQIQGLAASVRERDIRELVGEVEAFARKQPTMFFGGAVFFGFAALRFLKSTPSKETPASNARRED